MRAAIRESELTRYQIWKRSGVSQSVLCRFVNGRSGLSLDAVNRLAEVLGLELAVTDGHKRVEKGNA